MARDAGPWTARCAQGSPRDIGVDHHVYDDNAADALICPVLDQFDVHYELHHSVRSTPISVLDGRSHGLTHYVWITADTYLTYRMLILLGFASLISWIVRYRFLNMYARLPPAPERKETHIDLFPDTQEDTKAGLANYLDEFLSAIKVFGYRE